MIQLGNYSDGEFEAVIAAAAYAITSLEERESLRKQRGSVKFSGVSLPKTKSRNEDTNAKPTSFGGSFKRWFSDQEPKEDGKPEGSKRTESGKEMRPGPIRVPETKKFPASSFGNRNQAGYSPEQRKAEADADAWEKAQMIKIKNRYDKMMTMIMEWENEKKAKAKSRLEQKQNEPEQSRARASQKYEHEISRIEKVAGEARALAEERKRDNETKVRVKAEKIRSTGKIPRTCCCC